MKHHRYIGVARGFAAGFAASVATGLLVILLCLAPFRLAQATGGETGIEKEVNGYRVTLNFEKRVQTGNNSVAVMIDGPDGEPVSGAAVSVDTMPGDEHAKEAPEEHMEDMNTTDGGAAASQATEDASMSGGNQTAPTVEVKAASGSDMQMNEGSAPTPTIAPEMVMGGESTAAPEAVETQPVETSGSGIKPCTKTQPCDEKHTEGEGEPAGHEESAMVALKAAQEVGVYKGEVFIPESGDWAIRVHFTPQAGANEQHVDYMVAVVDAPPNWPVIGGFFGINLTVISVAAVMKQKSKLAIKA